ncbi:pyroglutamyl-peptidase 1 [Chelonus insularis]|uniref:pyroglutamyl-peptidase 1 n=1 Tax=Chelonus insularis TaxID=460826 RepID=UPI00158AA123|nr:pyroglutamyl-peptidase 1 [Chelonus insularis]
MDIIETRTVVVTGFGPFGKHSVNASWEAVNELAKTSNEKLKTNFNVQLITEEIPVIYDHVNDRIPQIWKEYDPLFLIHVGVSHMASCITIETAAHSSGYTREDITQKYPIECHDSVCKLIETGIDVNKMCIELNKSGICAACVSKNAGRYLCEYTYYQSLNIQPKRTLFIHVPDRMVYPCTVTAQALYFIITYLLKNYINK